LHTDSLIVSKSDKVMPYHVRPTSECLRFTSYLKHENTQMATKFIRPQAGRNLSGISQTSAKAQNQSGSNCQCLLLFCTVSAVIVWHCVRSL